MKHLAKEKKKKNREKTSKTAQLRVNGGLALFRRIDPDETHHPEDAKFHPHLLLSFFFLSYCCCVT